MIETVITLKGKSLHGKNRVNEQGAEWKVMAMKDHVQFPTTGIGPFLDLESVSNTEFRRWIASINDPDFEIIN